MGTKSFSLDKKVTVILSQSDETRPLCGIYFNLHSPYKKDSLPKTVQPFVEKSPKTGQPFFLYRAGLKTAEVKITGPQQENNTVADLVSGDARVGDTVRDE